MKLAIMQPYLFPYLGYFQLVAQVDKFVFYDDVNFIKNGWINRNRLCVAGAPNYLTVPLDGASPFQPINEVSVQPGPVWRKKVVERLRHSYAKAPHFAAVNKLVSDIILADEHSIAAMAKRSVVDVSNYIGVAPGFVMSSSIYGNNDLNGSGRVIDICKKESATQYLNLPGGKELYDEAEFAAAGVELGFVETRLPVYPQFSAEFIPGLSIIDVLMFNAPGEARQMLAPVGDA